MFYDCGIPERKIFSSSLRVFKFHLPGTKIDEFVIAALERKESTITVFCNIRLVVAHYFYVILAVCYVIENC